MALEAGSLWGAEGDDRFRIYGCGFSAWHVELQGSGFWVQGLGFSASSLGSRAFCRRLQGLGFRA